MKKGLKKYEKSEKGIVRRKNLTKLIAVKKLK